MVQAVFCVTLCMEANQKYIFAVILLVNIWISHSDVHDTFPPYGTAPPFLLQVLLIPASAIIISNKIKKNRIKKRSARIALLF